MKCIEKVNINKKRYKINDFLLHTDTSNNACVGKNYIKNGEKLKRVSILAKTIVPYYACNMGNRTIVLTEDGGVYIDNDGIFVLCARFSSGKRKVVEFNQNEEPSLLLMGKDDTVFFNGKTTWTAKVPTFQCATRLGDLFFIGIDNKIMFEKLENVKYSSAFDALNVITMPKHAGNVLELIAQGKELFVVCQKAIIKINALGEPIDYKVEAISTPSLEVKPNSVKKVGNKICFINGKTLCAFSQGTLKDIKTIADFNGAEVLYCGAMGGKYILQYTFNGKQDNFVSVIDIENQAESTFIGQITSVADEGVFVVDGQIYRLGETGNSMGDFLWESKALDFDNPDEKTITSLSVRVQGQVDLAIVADYGQKIFRFNQGFFTKKTNLRSKTFRIKVLSNSEFSLDALSVSYY